MIRPRLVSVIMPFWNAERFICEAIESVFAQSYKDWELLLVDDGSTDGSTRIAHDYANQFPTRVRYFSHDARRNRGISASRNLGIKHSSGGYTTFLDADDTFLPGKLEEQVDLLEIYPAIDMIAGSALLWHSWTGQTVDRGRDRMWQVTAGNDEVVEPPGLLITHSPLGKAHSPAICSLMIRRTLFQRTGGFEEAFAGMFEDQAFLTKAYLSAHVLITSKCYARYRQHPESCCAIALQTKRYASEFGRLLEWVTELLEKQAISNREVRRAMQRALWRYRHPLLERLNPHELIRRLSVTMRIATAAAP